MDLFVAGMDQVSRWTGYPAGLQGLEGGEGFVHMAALLQLNTIGKLVKRRGRRTKRVDVKMDCLLRETQLSALKLVKRGVELVLNPKPKPQVLNP